MRLYSQIPDFFEKMLILPLDEICSNDRIWSSFAILTEYSARNYIGAYALRLVLIFVVAYVFLLISVYAVYVA